MRGLVRLTILLMLILLGGCKQTAVGSKCPKTEDLQKLFDTVQRGLSVEKVEPSPVNGLCSVIFKLSHLNRGLVYVDSAGKYIVSGNIIEVATRKNLTQEKLEVLNKVTLTPQQLTELEKKVAFVHGRANKFVYLITDPDCPYCKRAEEILDEMVKAGKLAVKVVFFPLDPIHPQAKAKAISIFCDKKGFDGLKQGYQSQNQCEGGKKLVEDSQKFLSELGVRGTPTFVFPDGEMKSGVLPKEFILQKLGIQG